MTCTIFTINTDVVSQNNQEQESLAPPPIYECIEESTKGVQTKATSISLISLDATTAASRRITHCVPRDIQAVLFESEFPFGHGWVSAIDGCRLSHPQESDMTQRRHSNQKSNLSPINWEQLKYIWLIPAHSLWFSQLSRLMGEKWVLFIGNAATDCFFWRLLLAFCR